RDSCCIVTREERSSEEIKARLRLFVETSDGFEVARHDLALRGSGDVLGTRQSGLPRFRFGDPIEDCDLMERARSIAIEIVRREGVERSSILARKLFPAEMTAVPSRD
ncbi:MAG: ATP-dependent DNA helicase RecG, partial [Thermoanaerobaculia bacterium]|nr:ATP-dependent DNA helicase RecG [Thermoanaerobaculia bacterium]